MAPSPFSSRKPFAENPGDALRAAKLRVTIWRKRLLSVLPVGQPVTRTELANRLSSFDVRVGSSTLHYLLTDFLDAGVLECIHSGDGTQTRYRRVGMTAGTAS